jgi:general secretion pathway protein H
VRARTPPARLAGFTLLEILVVVLIIGIVSAGILLSLNFAGKDTALETESQRLLSLVKYARDQAELQTRNYGILFSQNGYEFVVYDVRQGTWRPVYEDDALRARTLPSGLDFKLVVDARDIVLHDRMPSAPASDSDSDSSASAFAPQVMIFSSGDLSSFSVTLERASAGRSITLDENQDGDVVEKPMLESGT